MVQLFNSWLDLGCDPQKCVCCNLNGTTSLILRDQFKMFTITSPEMILFDFQGCYRIRGSYN